MPASGLEPAYGYLRVHDASREEVALLEKQLEEYAEAHDLHLRQIYRERHSALRVGGLGNWLVESGVQHLIVPSLIHVSEHPIARLVFCEAVCLDARAEIHEACPEAVSM